MKLAMFLACEKVIVDRMGNASLIGILQTLNVVKNPNEPIPANAVGPKDWALAAMWIPTEKDVSKTYDQLFEIFLPDGTSFAKPTVQFTVSNTKPAMNFVQMNAIPLGQVGNLLIKSWVEDQGKSISEVAKYQIEITHNPVPPSGVIQ